MHHSTAVVTAEVSSGRDNLGSASSRTLRMSKRTPVPGKLASLRYETTRLSLCYPFASGQSRWQDNIIPVWKVKRGTSVRIGSERKSSSTEGKDDIVQVGLYSRFVVGSWRVLWVLWRASCARAHSFHRPRSSTLPTDTFVRMRSRASLPILA